MKVFNLLLVLIEISLITSYVEYCTANRHGYIGCYKDGTHRDLKSKYIHVGIQMTRQLCHHYCKSRGFKYYGLQVGDWCFCGNRYGTYGKAPESQCSSKCKGNRHQICGGGLRNSVYSTAPTKKAVVYIGCFKDGTHRDMKHYKHVGKKATIYFCNEFCKKSGYRYFGLQAGDWCFCGNSFGRYGMAKRSKCSVPCRGNKEEICGGGMTNSVYKTGILKKSSKPTTTTSETALCVDPYTKLHHKLNSRWITKHGEFCFHYHCHKSAKGPEKVDCQDKHDRCVKSTTSGKEFKCRQGAHRCKCLKEGGHTYIQQEHYEEY